MTLQDLPPALFAQVPIISNEFQQPSPHANVEENSAAEPGLEAR